MIRSVGRVYRLQVTGDWLYEEHSLLPLAVVSSRAVKTVSSIEYQARDVVPADAREHVVTTGQMSDADKS